MKSWAMVVDGQRGVSDEAGSAMCLMLGGSKFFLSHLDLLETQSSNGFSIELTIRFYRQVLSYKKYSLGILVTVHFAEAKLKRLNIFNGIVNSRGPAG